MSKKRVFATIFSLCIIIVIGVLAGVVFVVRDVEVIVNDNDGTVSTISKEDMIKETQIKTGTSIFGISESKVVSNIERAFPSIKVQNIERVFPNKILINVVERVPLVAIKFKGQNVYLILDNNMCAIKKIDVNNNADADDKLKEFSVVRQFELEGQRDIYLGKQLPRIYGDEVVIVQHILQGLIDSGMELNQIKDFLGDIIFENSVKNVHIKTNYGTGDGVTIKIDYSNIENNKKVAYQMIGLARKKFLTLETNQKSSGYLIYDDMEENYVYSETA